MTETLGLAFCVLVTMAAVFALFLFLRELFR